MSGKVAHVVSQLAGLGDLLAYSVFLFLRDWVRSNLEQHDKALVYLKVCNGDVVGASNPSLSVTLETCVEEWDHLVEVSVELLLVFISDGLLGQMF